MPILAAPPQVAAPVSMPVDDATRQRALLLALVLTPGNDRERRAWQEVTRGLPQCDALRERAVRLPGRARLPLLATLAGELAKAPLTQRQSLLVDARRLMCADGRVSALDRLTWLALRQWLGGRTLPHRGGLRDDAELTQLPLAQRQAIGQFTAYLARLVPATSTEPGTTVSAGGAAWHDAVMRHTWGEASPAPTCHVPDVDALGRALQLLQSLGWMHRPVLVRCWTEQAVAASGRRLGTRDDATPSPAAEALWLACALLDTPLPPALAERFAETPGQGREAGGT